MRAARIQQDKLIVRYWLEKRGDEPEGSDPRRFIEPTPDKITQVVPAGVPAQYVWMDAIYHRPRWSEFSRTWIERLEALRGENTKDCHFIVASCWYPGMPTDRERNDQAFDGIGKIIQGKEPCDALFLIGDQIYADANGGILDPGTWLDRYAKRYQEAFSGARAAAPFKLIPTHFAIDDHEIANDYAGIVASDGAGLMPGQERIARIEQGDIDDAQLRFARAAASAYVGSARDAGKNGPFGTSSAGPGDLWYELDELELPCPAFILDTRSERARAENGSRALLFKKDGNGVQRQLDRLRTWLESYANDSRPKFLFSGSVIAPQTDEMLVVRQHGQVRAPSLWMRQDNLMAYPDELEAIFDCIVDRQIRRVVFVSGDLHLSALSKLEICDAKGSVLAEAGQVVASALYAPFSFINTSKSDITWQTPVEIAVGKYLVRYVSELVTDAPAHFVKVSAVNGSAKNSPWRIQATPYDPQGRPLLPARVMWL
jgi:cholesterol oxidase